MSLCIPAVWLTVTWHGPIYRLRLTSPSMVLQKCHVQGRTFLTSYIPETIHWKRKSESNGPQSLIWVNRQEINAIAKNGNCLSFWNSEFIFKHLSTLSCCWIGVWPFNTFERGQLTCPQCFWASLLGSLPVHVLSAHSFASNWQLPFLNQQERMAVEIFSWPKKFCRTWDQTCDLQHTRRIRIRLSYHARLYSISI